MTQLNEGQDRKEPDGSNTYFALSNRDYACIHLKVPQTKKPWLDALITESLRNEMAGRAMTGILAGKYGEVQDSLSDKSYKEAVARCSYQFADAMLSTGKGEE